ncbi:MAG TPA: RNA methyltransferase [bacterium]|nr:RNA methyltransferase [bacterium]
MLSKTKLKKIAALKNKKNRDHTNLFLVEGLRLCQEALASNFNVQTLLLDPAAISSAALNNITSVAQRDNVEVLELDAIDVKQLAVTVNSQSIFCVVEKPNYPAERLNKENDSFIVIVDRGQDPGNIGTLIRSCDWFGVDAVVLSRGTVELYNPKVIRSSMGSVFHLPIFENIELQPFILTLKQQNFEISAADAAGDKNFHQTTIQFPHALIIGNENQGVAKNISNLIDYQIKIPGFGKAESLNMACAGAILISHFKIH